MEVCYELNEDNISNGINIVNDIDSLLCALIKSLLEDDNIEVVSNILCDILYEESSVCYEGYSIAKCMYCLVMCNIESLYPREDVERIRDEISRHMNLYQQSQIINDTYAFIDVREYLLKLSVSTYSLSRAIAKMNTTPAGNEFDEYISEVIDDIAEIGASNDVAVDKTDKQLNVFMFISNVLAIIKSMYLTGVI